MDKYYGTTSAAQAVASAPKRSQVDSAKDRLDSSIGESAALVDDVACRLQSVILDRDPHAQNTGCDTPIMAPLALDLTRYADRVDLINMQLRRLLAALEV